MPKTQAGAVRATRPDADEDLDVIGTEVSPEEADAEDATVGRTQDPEDVDPDPDQEEPDPEAGGEVDDDDYEDVDTSRTARTRGTTRLDKFSARLARQERITNEVRSENRQLAESNRQLVTQVQKLKTDEDLEKKRAETEASVAVLKISIKAAKEAGDTDKEIDLIEKLADVKGEMKRAEAMAEVSKGAAQAVSQAPQRFQRLAEQWKRKHQRYNTDSNFAAVANALDTAIAKDGFDKNSDEYWRELDRRMKRLYPKEYGVKPGQRTPRHPASGPGEEDEQPVGRRTVNGNEHTFQKRGKAYVLTQRDMRIMRTVGLDPDDDTDRKTFVRENL